MYSTVLLIHSWLRWAALVGGVGATFSAGSGDDARAERFGLGLMMVLDVQMLLGLLLYFVLSPFTTVAMNNFGAAMRDPALRFWAIEHISMMFVAVVAVHIGRVLARKAATPAQKRSRLFFAFGVATAAMVAGIPWPGLAIGRPLFRF